MLKFNEKLVLQAIVAVFGLLPIGAGAAGVVMGVTMVTPGAGNPSLDSHFRYLSGLLLALGLGFWSTIPAIEKHTVRFRILTAIVFVGGLARLASLIFTGAPALPMIDGLVMELFVTPFLCWWQSRLACRALAEKN